MHSVSTCSALYSHMTNIFLIFSCQGLWNLINTLINEDSFAINQVYSLRLQMGLSILVKLRVKRRDTVRQTPREFLQCLVFPPVNVSWGQLCRMEDKHLGKVQLCLRSTELPRILPPKLTLEQEHLLGFAYCIFGRSLLAWSLAGGLVGPSGTGFLGGTEKLSKCAAAEDCAE